MDISKLTLEQVKAMAYDEICKLESAQSNLKILNDRIRLLNNIKPLLPKEKECTKKDSQSVEKK